MDAESLPSSSETHHKSLDTKSCPCEKLKPEAEPGAAPPSPRTLLAVQAALLGSSSEEELDAENPQRSDVRNRSATKDEGAVSPLTLLAIQKALDDDDDDVTVHAGKGLQRGGSGAQTPHVSSSDGETDERLAVTDGKGMQSMTGPHSGSGSFVEERVTSANNDAELARSARLSGTVFCQGSESSVPEEQVSPVHMAREASQASEESTVKDRKEPVPSGGPVVMPSRAPGLQSGRGLTAAPPPSPRCLSRDDTYTKALELQEPCPSESKYDSSVIASDGETERETNSASEVVSTVSLQETSNRPSVPSETISNLENAVSFHAIEHENCLKTIQEHEMLGSAGQDLISTPESMEPVEIHSEESESDGRCLCLW